MSRYILILLAAILPIACSAAEEAKYQYREHYMPARKAISDANPQQVDVYEIFWYGCPHCYQFDPKLEAWVDNELGGRTDVKFARIPASLGRPQGILHSKAYYTAQALGVGDKMHHAIFDAMHKHRQQLNSEAAIEALFVNNGIMPDVFRATFNSFSVESQVQQAENTIRSLGITSVPSMSVDLKYWTGSGQAGGFQGMLDVVDFLIAKAKK